MVISGNTLYGTAVEGGSPNAGTVFAVNTDGTGYTLLHDFNYSDGCYPQAGLILSGNTLYGTLSGCGPLGNGTVFAVNTDGTGFTNLYSFTGGSDGGDPSGGLILSGNMLYGTAAGGTEGNGTVFAVSTNGTGFTTLHSFTSDPGGSSHPPSGLILSGNTLYGTTFGSTAANGSYGTVFAVNTDGTGFTTLYSFSGGSDGSWPKAGLILSGNTLYGTTSGGQGRRGSGTVFSLTLPPPPPQLTIIPSEPYVILTWPTDYAGSSYAGYTLQSTTNLVSPAVWSSVSPEPVVIGGQNVVVNTISAAQQFYRLSK